MNPENNAFKTATAERLFTKEELEASAEGIKKPEQETKAPFESVEVAIPPEVMAKEQEQLSEVRARLAQVPEAAVPSIKEEKPVSPHRQASEDALNAEKSAFENLRAKYDNKGSKDLKREEKRLTKAIELVHKGKLDKADKLYHGGELRDVIAGEIKLMTVTGDMTGLRKLAENNVLMNIYPENMRLLPREVIESPKIQAKIQAHVEKSLFGGSWVDRSSDNAFGWIKRYEDMGILSPQTIAAMGDNRNIQKSIQKELKGVFKRGLKGAANNPRGNATAMANKYVEAGLISARSAEDLVEHLQ